MNKYNNYYKPPPRGQSTSDIGYHHQNNQYHPGHQQLGPARAQTPNYDRAPQVVRGPTPSYEQEQRSINFRTNNGNYQVFPRGATPTNLTSGNNWNYAEDSDLRRGNVHIGGSHVNSNRDQLMHRQEVLPPSGGNYGNQSIAYRDPVYSAMAGKRPVKSLQQPNSAKV